MRSIEPTEKATTVLYCKLQVGKILLSIKKCVCFGLGIILRFGLLKQSAFGSWEICWFPIYSDAVQEVRANLLETPFVGCKGEPLNFAFPSGMHVSYIFTF